MKNSKPSFFAKKILEILKKYVIILLIEYYMKFAEAKVTVNG